MPYEFYKVLHIAGLVLTLFGLFGLASVLWNGATPKPALRKIWLIAHGVGLALLLVAGFGLAARLGLARQMPHWIYAKMVIWLVIGGIPVLIRKKPGMMALWLVIIFILVLLAALLAITKAF